MQPLVKRCAWNSNQFINGWQYQVCVQIVLSLRFLSTIHLKFHVTSLPFTFLTPRQHLQLCNITTVPELRFGGIAFPSLLLPSSNPPDLLNNSSSLSPPPYKRLLNIDSNHPQIQEIRRYSLSSLLFPYSNPPDLLVDSNSPSPVLLQIASQHYTHRPLLNLTTIPYSEIRT